MFFAGIILTFFLCGNALGQTKAGTLWAEFAAKREKLKSAHEEFEVSHTFKTDSTSQSSKHEIVLDLAQGEWREKSLAGSGDHVRIFDGKDLVSMEDDGEEYVRVKRKPKDPDPLPSPYQLRDPEWNKATEVERRPCGFATKDHECVVIDAPLKKWMRSGTHGMTRMLQGSVRAVFDTETGLLLSGRTVETIEAPYYSYLSDQTYMAKRVSLNAAPDVSLFQLPTSLKEVKELSRWDADKIKRKLATNPAPELNVMDIQGKPFNLADYKGKTVLLDFWATWCPPCVADGPALDRLYKKYGDRDLMIVGISVNEDREIVEKFLKKRPHDFPVVLTTENEMPRPYQIGVFPTYIIINRDGKLETAVQGDKGFGDLKILLKRAGLESE